MSLSESKKKILLVEDNPADARLIKEYFKEIEQSSNFIIEHLDKLSPAAEKIKDDKVDLVLLDLFLPDSDGVDTFVKLHSKFASLPIVVLTGLNDIDLAEKVVGIGAQDYLVKADLKISRLKNILINAFSREFFKKEKNKFNTSTFYKKSFPYSINSKFKTRINTFAVDSTIEDLDSIFHFFIEIYQSNLKTNVPGMEDKVKASLSESLSSENEAFAMLDLSPLDLVLIHNNALKDLSKAGTGELKQNYLKISRLMLFELMNITLKHYYERSNF